MELGISFSGEPELFAILLKTCIDFMVSHRDGFPENAVVIPYKYADAVADACGEFRPLIPTDRNPHLVCEYKDFKIYYSFSINDKDVWFTTTGEIIKEVYKKVYAPYSPFEEESE